MTDMQSHYNIDSFQFDGSIAHALQSAASHIDLEFGRLFGAQQLTCQQWAVLMVLREKRATTAADLSRRHRYDAGSLSRAIDGLFRRGLVERERSQDDRRIVLLYLTAEGTELGFVQERLLAGLSRAQANLAENQGPARLAAQIGQGSRGKRPRVAEAPG